MFGRVPPEILPTQTVLTATRDPDGDLEHLRGSEPLDRTSYHKLQEPRIQSVKEISDRARQPKVTRP